MKKFVYGLKPGLLILIVNVVLWSLIITGCSYADDNQAVLDSKAEPEIGEEVGLVEQNKDFDKYSIPPLEFTIPENLETATFGLG
jgi:hypothetical protein